MKIFVTGATGFVGSAVVRELLDAGHQVLGLVRSKEDASKLSALGAQAHLGDLKDMESLREGAAAADGLIHTAFNHDFTRFKESCEEDRLIIQAFGEVYARDHRPMVVTSALGVMPRGRMVYESDKAVSSPNPRIATEQACDAVAAHQGRVSVVRLSPSVHGPGDHGFIPMLIKIARDKGVSVYQEEGQNCWPAVHRLDVAKLYRLAVEKSAPAGTRYHGLAEEGIPFREIAEAIGEGLKIPVRSMSKEDAAAHFGSFAHFAAMDIRASSQETQQSLGWKPVNSGLLADLQGHVYFNHR